MQLFLLLVVILSHVSMATAVDVCHRGRDKDHRLSENCTAAGFSTVPGGIEPTTKVLLFRRNLFTSLSWASFQTFTEIYEIDLTGNKVPEVTPSATPILPTLSVLRLGSNSLKSLSDGSFSACPALTELYLENNIIHSLSDHTFSGLSKLEILDLSSNHIRVLPKLMLHPLSAIETLYLEGNKIKVMPDDWFSQKTDVPYLFLSANPWACSCSLDYFHTYLNEYEFNVYVRDGPNINVDVDSVVCASPQQHHGKPIISLEKSDLCSPSVDLDLADDTYHNTNTDGPTTTDSFPINTVEIPSTTTVPFASEITSPAAPAVATVVYHRVVTWSYQTFPSLIEWSHHSGSAARGDGLNVWSHASSTGTTVPPVRPLTESPAVIVTTSLTTTPSTTTPAASTVVSPTQKLWVDTTPFATEATTVSIPSLVVATEATSLVTDEAVDGVSSKIRAQRAAGVLCFWLFAGCLLLCVASAACTLATVARIVIWYRRVYKPLSITLATRRRGGREGVGLLTFSRKEEKETTGGGGGVVALYRSVLYVHRAGGEAGEKEGEGGEGGGNERVLVNLEPTAGGTRKEEGERGGKEERGVYRKTLYRLLSKEEEIEGWRDVMEECQISVEDGGRKEVRKDGEMGGGGVSKKRYSVILREEREEAGGGMEELDWVVGGWEVKREGGRQEEEPRSSWGEWLAHYLPSMPWGVTTPPEGEATL